MIVGGRDRTTRTDPAATAGLPGPYGNGQLWTVIRFTDTSDPIPDAFTFLTSVGVLDTGGSDGTSPQAPQDAAQLSARMREASQVSPPPY